VNVSRALAAGDVATVAVIHRGASRGTSSARCSPRTACRWSGAHRGVLRSNITVVDGGTTTKFNEAGPVLSPDEVGALERTVDGGRRPCDVGWPARAACQGGLGNDS